jgi:hypothetical protein
MRMRGIAVSVVLSLVVAGITSAQHTGEQPKGQAAERTKLRVQVVKLRVDIELLELEHEATRAEILEMTKDIRNSESEGPEGLKGMALGLLSLTDGEALAKHVEKKGADGVVKQVDKAVKDAQKETLNQIKASREDKKKDYAKQAAELAEKRLELAGLEKRYSESR